MVLHEMTVRWKSVGENLLYLESVALHVGGFSLSLIGVLLLLISQHDFNFKSVILQSASIWMSCLNKIKRFNKAQMKFHRKTGFLVALSFCPLVLPQVLPIWLFATEISKWVFHERGHLKAVNVRHYRVGETDEPASYRINDELEYLVEIYEWSGSNWEPYVANDVQVQFYMMSPYVLKTMSTDKKGLYLASFKIPVRPFRHNEYERSIPTTFPYYRVSFSTTEQMSRIVNEFYSIHFSIKKASQLVKEIGRQVATDRCNGLKWHAKTNLPRRGMCPGLNLH
ncbi:hypothetical protein L1887_14856 [Cichorium endivia]|nr:hypothetical protein L1887_14856 [Cichorium endivia]